MKLMHAASAALVAAACANGASAQNYPSKPVRLIVPYAAGGGVDILGRIVAAKLTESLGVQVIVDDRAGGGTIIGSEAVAKAPPDGYTLLFTNAALTASPALNEKLPFDPVKSFAPVAMVAGSYNVLIVHPSLPVKTVKDLVALAKSKPGQLNYASGGVGSAIHLAMELFASRANIDVVHIPYKGAGPALTDVLGGQVLTMFATPVAAMPYIKTGRLRPLGVSSLKRLAFLPDVPTIAESGYPGFEVNNWYGMLAPAGTPRELVTRLNTTVNALLAMPDVKERIGALGAEPQPGTPEQFAQRVSKEVSGWTQVLGKRRSRAH
jgi:tripartite-type tricarboxylate transporter receptor subunit TctC